LLQSELLAEAVVRAGRVVELSPALGTPFRVYRDGRSTDVADRQLPLPPQDSGDYDACERK
jgi:hypothetical protein